MPRFSVIIPAFNSSATIVATLESVFGQSFTDYEVIVVNDGSWDDTAQVLQRYCGRITVVTQENRGLSGARNAGIRASHGEWIALLDADDSWSPDKLERVAEAIEVNPELALFYSDAFCCDADGMTRRGGFMPPQLMHPPSRADLFENRFQILPSSAVIRAEAFFASGGFSEEFRGASGFEDIYFWLRLREIGGFGYIPEKLVNYRVAPLPLRLERYRPGFAVFCRLVRDRYGLEGEGLIRARRRARVNLWGQAGAAALARGDVAAARRAFWGAVREDPRRVKYVMRLLRSFLPFAGRQRLDLQGSSGE